MRGFWLSTRLWLFGASLFAAAIALPAEAQEADAGAEASYRQAFAYMSEHLDDPEASFAFAEAASAVGDYAGAVAALERVLQIDPSRDNIRLEIGLLYRRLGHPDLAAAYIKSALRSPDMPDYVRARALAALAESEQAGARSSLNGEVFASLQHETNPNATPDSALVFDFARGRSILLGADQLTANQNDDFALVLGGNLEYRRQWDTQAQRDWVVDASAYSTTYRDVDGLDALALSLRAGPGFYSPTTSTRPYLALSTLRLDGDAYFTGAGLGLVHQHAVGRRATLTLIGQWEQRTFSNSTLRPTATLQDGDYYGGAVDLRFDSGFKTVTSFRIGGDRGAADAAFESFNRLDVGASTMRQVAGALRLTLGVDYRHTQYDKPDPLISNSILRVEDRYWAGVTAEAPIAAHANAQVRVEQTWNKSTLPNYRYDDLLIAVGVSRRF